MSPFRLVAVAALAAAGLSLSVASAAPARPSAHARARAPAPAPAPAPAATAAGVPIIAANAYLLLDFASGTPLVAQNADERRDPASLTKLMTAYVAFAALKEGKIMPSQIVPVSPAAWHAEGSRMFIEPKRAVSVDELLHGVVIQSGNDASIAIAEAVAGNETAFVAMMNAEAARMGLAGTHFTNATGLPGADHYSTARDLAVLAAALI